jgi:hypothetical protein
MEFHCGTFRAEPYPYCSQLHRRQPRMTQILNCGSVWVIAETWLQTSMHCPIIELYLTQLLHMTLLARAVGTTLALKVFAQVTREKVNGL